MPHLVIHTTYKLDCTLNKDPPGYQKKLYDTGYVIVIHSRKLLTITSNPLIKYKIFIYYKSY